MSTLRLIDIDCTNYCHKLDLLFPELKYELVQELWHFQLIVEFFATNDLLSQPYPFWLFLSFCGALIPRRLIMNHITLEQTFKLFYKYGN